MRSLRILDDVYLVGSGEIGLSHPLDCHIYLLDGGETMALIDAGIGLSADQLVANLENGGLEADRIGYLLLTHSHIDHARGCSQLRQRLICRVATSAGEARLLSEGTEVELGLAQAKHAKVYPHDMDFIHTQADLIVEDGDVIEVGRYRVRCVVVPGHTPASVCYFAELNDGRALFAGDTIFWGGRIGLNNIPGSELTSYRSGIRKLVDLGVDALLPGHFLWTVSGGQSHIDKAAEALKGSQVPLLPVW